ncbi:Thioredoxin-dependent peroxide reductase, mitochondrial [Trichinella pseudospiralis]|uniref:thioredoxin-dependent peroxiredoxin n=1 Tax=Trichinella pseudospiralis TaxID=6337 RepID=A0A0V0YNL1_TRIPS|nr:Thioredoxin-dependent peroxide reductase, mitochondrial [Trichinella pseudospiralis]
MLPQMLFRQSVTRCMRLTSVPLRLSHHKHDAKDEYQTITITYPKGSNISPSTPVLPRPQEKAPDFKSQAVISRKISEIKLSDYKGKWLILFFYPMDFTFVCPTEIIAFNDRAGEFKEINCELIACSTDSHFSHFGWINTPRKEGGLGEMKIPLMADFTKSISRSYGVLLEKDGIALRGLFLIDPHGILKHVSVNDLPVGRSVDEALRLVKAFQFFEKHGEVCPANWKPDGPTIKPNVDQAKEYFSKLLLHNY